MKKIILVFFLFALSACAGKLIPIATNDAIFRATNYTQSQITLEPASVQGYIRLSDESSSLRLNYILWSNGTFPLRTDLMHSQAGLVAKILENEDLLIIYTPENNQANRIHASSKQLIISNMQLPFSLLELNYLMQGNFKQVFGNLDFNQVYEANSDNYKYKVDSGFIVLNSLGEVVSFEDSSPSKWKINFEYKENGQLNYIRAENKNEQIVTIQVREVNIYENNYSNDKLELVLPVDVIYKEIEAKRK